MPPPVSYKGWLTLTKTSGNGDEPVHVLPAAVVSVTKGARRQDDAGHTILVLASGRSVHVVEPVDAVMAKIVSEGGK